jgi:hypothetical protein
MSEYSEICSNMRECERTVYQRTEHECKECEHKGCHLRNRRGAIRRMNGYVVIKQSCIHWSNV